MAEFSLVARTADAAFGFNRCAKSYAVVAQPPLKASFICGSCGAEGWLFAFNDAHD
ncbi:MAG: hypothetical protein AB7I79_10870 [Rhizobiaceae bacterium]